MTASTFKRFLDMYWCIIDYLLTLNSSITLSFRHNIININMISVIFLLQRIMCGPILSSLSQMNTSLAMFSMRMGQTILFGCFRKWWVSPKSSILIGFSMIFIIHFGDPYFWKHPFQPWGANNPNNHSTYSTPLPPSQGFGFIRPLDGDGPDVPRT